ncbi:cytochrome P450 [Haloprofundus marisrubri]|uniref:Cytochrome P450 n=1 Tax=Haloprofundus marisrubri TaxID=1514971 RepID=A0A0W1R405_9EURY|nr:cytochrome P450 [Haloprofundus marisrubri]KTG07947.1 cytochrome P450 [Haloprofundus marisrubri]
MRARPPGPRGVPLFGNSQQYAKDPFSFLTACADAYGDVVHFDLGPLETYMLTNPDDIETVLVSEAEKYRKPRFQDDAIGDLLGEGLLMSEGETWREQRELAQPAFNMQRIASLDETMTDYTEAMLDDWHDGETLNVQIEMARLTVKIIVEAMFGSSAGDERVQRVQEHLEPLGARFEPDPRRFLIPDWAPTRENREYHEAISVLEDIIDDIVSDRRGTESDPERMDLLSILMRAQARGEQTDKQLRDEMMTMLLAGHDTTALTLTYAWFMLSQHPEVEEKVHAELDEVLGGDAPTARDTRKMRYTDQVLQETMRLYPPVYTLFREPLVDVKLGGYRVPEGAAVMLPQWAVHRSSRYYDNPLEFDPDRWTPAERSKRPRLSYFPFGAGPRHCIGKQFSMLEAKLILGTVAQKYSLDYVGEDDSLTLRGSLTMHPRNPMEMQLHSR